MGESRNDIFDPREHVLPHVVDHYKSFKPEAVYAEYPQSPHTYEKGYRVITYGDLAHAVDGVAHLLVDNIGLGDGTQALAYIGPNDVRYTALSLGAVKAGHTMFFPSSRNSITAHMKLLDQMQCDTLVTPSPQPAAITTILHEATLRVIEIPEVECLLAAQTPPVPYKRDLPQAASEELLTIHTSGSTGLPKPMTFTNDTAARGMKMFFMEPPAGYDGQNFMMTGKRVFLMLPPFHGVYLASHLLNAIPFDTIMISPISSTIPSAPGLVEALKHTKADVAIVAPSIVEELAQTPELLKYCAKHLECILYSGGDLPQKIGNFVASSVRILNQFGSTELGLVPLVLSPSRQPEDWKYLEFHPDLGMEFRPVLGDQHELHLVRNPLLEGQQLTFTYPGYSDLQDYATGDLFVRHPLHKNLWKWDARRDDILVFLNGEKTNPISMEQHIARHPIVNGVLVAGARQFQPALLLEVKAEWGNLDKNTLLDKLWPTIDEANKGCPAYARIAKSHVLFTNSVHPMKRSGKGSIQRAATVNLYGEHLNSLYNKVALMEDSEHLGNHVSLSRHDAFHFVRATIQQTTGWKELDDDDDFFLHGMDSLETIMAVRAMRKRFHMDEITPPLVYTHSSVRDLTGAIMQLNGRETPSVVTSNDHNKLEQRHTILKHYRGVIDQLATVPQEHHKIRAHCILLTESLDGLGPYLLCEFLKSPIVDHVYCPSRVADARSAQREENKHRQLEVDLNPSRVTFLQADLTKRDMEVASEELKYLQENITLIVHNSWPVDLNLSLSSFRPQLDGVMNLIHLSACSRARPRLFFTSSIGAMIGYESDTMKVPEDVVKLEKPAVNGYAESRYVAEHILAYANGKIGVPVSIARLTYVPGPTQLQSSWNLSDWMPSLIFGSLHIGAVPETLGPRMNHIDWVPIDLLAGILVELALDRSKLDDGAPQVFHPVNPSPSNWDSMRTIVVDEIQRVLLEQLEVIPLQQWLGLIQKARDELTRDDHESTGETIEANPATRIYDFYHKLFQGDSPPVLPETKQTRGRSGLLLRIPGIEEAWMRKWTREWIEQLR